ncbi:MAG: hypothetical protein M3347_01800, partial [Armatimonadota bacterium]|nr:hypothetical protein [Armatimonadota bacterium]
MPPSLPPQQRRATPEDKTPPVPTGPTRDYFPTFRAAPQKMRRGGRVLWYFLKRCLSGLRWLFSRRGVPWRVVRWLFSRRVMLRLFIVAVMLHIGFNIYASIVLNRELATLRSRGEPLTLAELAPPPVPAAQNAALVYEKAAAALPPKVKRRVTGSLYAGRSLLNQRELEASRPAVA